MSRNMNAPGNQDNSTNSNIQQLVGILLRRGVSCRLISNDGFSCASVLSLSLVDDKLFILWRTTPSSLGCEIVFLQRIVRGVVHDPNQYLVGDRCLSFVFQNLVVQVGFADAPTATVLANALEALLKESLTMEQQDPKKRFMFKFRQATFDISAREEKVHQNTLAARKRQGVLLAGKILHNSYIHSVKLALYKWTAFVSAANHIKMVADRALWRLHAASSTGKDLQAWYHAVFFREIYRLPGAFWYKDAMLSTYRKAYSPSIDTTLTQLEEAALAHVLCSPDTTYGDVAGQMFVVQALTTPEQFQFFQKICADGSAIVKFPRSGKAGKKMFRFSFVEGNIFLTWKGKYGNQGIDMEEVTAIVPGINTEILQRRANPETPELYLSVICADRSIDLFFETEYDRDDWKALLEILLQKEHGLMHGVKSVRPPMPPALREIQNGDNNDEKVYVNSSLDDDYEWLLLFDCIGRNCISDEMFKGFSVR